MGLLTLNELAGLGQGHLTLWWRGRPVDVRELNPRHPAMSDPEVNRAYSRYVARMEAEVRADPGSVLLVPRGQLRPGEVSERDETGVPRTRVADRAAYLDWSRRRRFARDLPESVKDEVYRRHLQAGQRSWERWAESLLRIPPSGYAGPPPAGHPYSADQSYRNPTYPTMEAAIGKSMAEVMAGKFISQPGEVSDYEPYTQEWWRAKATKKFRAATDQYLDAKYRAPRRIRRAYAGQGYGPHRPMSMAEALAAARRRRTTTGFTIRPFQPGQVTERPWVDPRPPTPRRPTRPTTGGGVTYARTPIVRAPERDWPTTAPAYDARAALQRSFTFGAPGATRASRVAPAGVTRGVVTGTTITPPTTMVSMMSMPQQR
jgi:hypothetical protein